MHCKLAQHVRSWCKSRNFRWTSKSFYCLMQKSFGVTNPAISEQYSHLSPGMHPGGPTLSGCDSWSSTLQPEEHWWIVSLLEECGGPEFIGDSITHATWLHGFQAREAYVIGHAKHLFESRKLWGSITIAWTLRASLLETSWEGPFWSILIILHFPADLCRTVYLCWQLFQGYTPAYSTLHCLFDLDLPWMAMF